MPARTPSALNSLDGPEAPQLVIYTGENRPAGDKTKLLACKKFNNLGVFLNSVCFVIYISRDLCVTLKDNNSYNTLSKPTT